MADVNKDIYPHLVIKNNEHPNKLLAFPIVGIIIRTILLIPVYIVGWFLSIAYMILWIITPFVILFTGKYWDTAYNFNVGLMKLYTKVVLYMYGLTDKYPGFTMDTNGIFELQYEKPQKPNRWLSLPVFGLIIRLILLIPYVIYESVLRYGTYIAVMASWFGVTFTGKYPESLYEFNRDSTRVALARMGYITYMSDTYPSFWISMKHQTVKIVLIVIGALLMLSSFAGEPNPEAYDTDGAMYDSTQDATDIYSDF
ncbi:MAG: DUF4389 domain-containing protein [Candidatus Levybacteria bacterium]|nr:DUF4389 domain-containing protein [Candidatus Levybacteria bacterium]